MAILSEAERLFPEIDSPHRILVELKSIGLRVMEILSAFRDYAITDDNLRFWNSPSGGFMTTSWVIALPNRKEFGVFENTGAPEFWTPWFEDYLSTLNAERARIDHTGLTIRDGEFFPLEVIRFVKRPTDRRKKRVLPKLELDDSIMAERAASLLKSSEDTDHLVVYDLEDDEDAHNNRLQTRLEDHFATLFDSAKSMLEVKFGTPVRAGLDELDPVVRASGNFRFAVWSIAGTELALAACHEDRELPFLLILSKLRAVSASASSE